MYLLPTAVGRVNLCIVRFDSSARRLHCLDPPRGRSPFNPASFVHFSLIYVLLKCHTARGYSFKLSTEIIENEAQKKGNGELGGIQKSRKQKYLFIELAPWIICAFKICHKFSFSVKRNNFCLKNMIYMMSICVNDVFYPLLASPVCRFSLFSASFSSSHSILPAEWLLQSLAKTKLNPFPVRPLTRVERQPSALF